MKPTNIHKHGCNPISSNCVIWQGPDIDCIELCKGDTVSDVVFALATELCALMEMFDVTNYELDCLGLGECAPKDFQALIQLLIDKVCACCDVDPDPSGPTTEGCPDCEVTVCSDFYTTNASGDTVTTMQLVDYVRAIGNKVCDLILEIHTINLTLDNHETRITILEEAEPPIYTPPQVTPCNKISLPAVPTELNIALQQLMDQYCVYVGIIGDPTDVAGVLPFQCLDLATSPQLANPGSNMDMLPGWEEPVNTLEDSLRNMWLTICDMRAAIINIQENCCPTGCEGIEWIINAVIGGAGGNQLQIDYTGTMPVDFVDCTPGSTIEIVDGNGVTYVLTNQQLIFGYFGSATQIIDLTMTALNAATGLTITFTLCAYNAITDTTCSSQQIIGVAPVGACPTLTLSSPANDTILVDSIFGATGSYPTTCTVEIWNQAQTVMFQSQSFPVPGMGSYPLTFTGLAPGTTYSVRAVVGGLPCPWTTHVMPSGPCLPPGAISTSTTINP